MTHTIPTLKRESTRNLCDQFTNIFYDDVNPTVASSIDIALSLSISLAFNASKSSSSSSSLDAPSAAEYPSPAPSSEESDDSLLLDTLSPPSSPWFPSLSSSTDTVSKEHTKTSDDASAAAGEEVDFFRNPFYRSLHGHGPQTTDSLHPQSLFVQHTKKVSLPLAVKSAQHRSSSGQVSQTAAPSDLFNVSLDQILSAEPLNLSMETQQLLLSAVEEALTSSQEGGDKQQQGESSPSHEESDMLEDTLTSGSLSAPESDEDEEAEHGQLETDCGDQSDPDYCESTLIKQKKTRSAAVTKKTPRGGASTTGKAPRVRKGTYKRSLKVYPQRRPKSLVKQEEVDENDVEIKSDLSKNQGILLPGGFKLPLDKDGYLCEFCPKERFGRVHDLKRHQISKHNERTWPCDFCHRPFVRRDALLRHYAVKTARKDGVHPTAEDVDRLSEARARARLI
ncbi:hypothetical protein K457DRAFT_133831 [Linnemannia elongata AG-77]|uniref:C2H2-type domain-containing protein n=1 Tax=Linnemannia elongata AG-77 TaxID=1314771 RepID=A0A197KD02_9FUNG|nr:hypothetical protein K457DRAFT_133831 [Linnemannia elongata AG-77]